MFLPPLEEGIYGAKVIHWNFGWLKYSPPYKAGPFFAATPFRT